MSPSKKKLAINATANWLGTLANAAAVFVVAPILVRGLGDDRYGVWALVDSILAYLSIFDLGIGAAVVRFTARADGLKDVKAINRTFSTCLALFALSGLGVVAVASLILGPLWTLLPVPNDLEHESWWLLAILAFNLAVGLPAGVFAAVLVGLQRYVARTVVQVGTTVIRAVALIWVVSRGGDLVAVAATVTVLAVVQHVVIALLARSYLPGLWFSPSMVNKGSIGEIWSYSWNAMVAMIASRVSFQTDAIVIGAFLPVSQITFFALPARLCEYVKSFLRSLTTVLTPHISQLESRRDFDGIRRIYVKGSRYVLWFVLPFQIGIWFLGKPFFSLWVGPEYVDKCFPVLLILAAPLGLMLSQSIGGRILFGIGKLQHFSRLLVAEAVANVLLSIALVPYFGIIGVAAGTSIPNLIYNGVLIFHVCKSLDLSPGSYLLRAFALPCLVAVPFTLLCAALACFYPVSSWAGFVASGTVGCAAWALIVLAAEWSLTPAGSQSFVSTSARRILSLYSSD